MDTDGPLVPNPAILLREAGQQRAIGSAFLSAENFIGRVEQLGLPPNVLSQYLINLFVTLPTSAAEWRRVGGPAFEPHATRTAASLIVSALTLDEQVAASFLSAVDATTNEVLRNLFFDDPEFRYECVLQCFELQRQNPKAIAALVVRLLDGNNAEWLQQALGKLHEELTQRYKPPGALVAYGETLAAMRGLNAFGQCHQMIDGARRQLQLAIPADQELLRQRTITAEARSIRDRCAQERSPHIIELLKRATDIVAEFDPVAANVTLWEGLNYVASEDDDLTAEADRQIEALIDSMLEQDEELSVAHRIDGRNKDRFIRRCTTIVDNRVVVDDQRLRRLRDKFDELGLPFNLLRERQVIEKSLPAKQAKLNARSLVAVTADYLPSEVIGLSVRPGDPTLVEFAIAPPAEVLNRWTRASLNRYQYARHGQRVDTPWLSFTNQVNCYQARSTVPVEATQLVELVGRAMGFTGAGNLLGYDRDDVERVASAIGLFGPQDPNIAIRETSGNVSVTVQVANPAQTHMPVSVREGGAIVLPLQAEWKIPVASTDGEASLRVPTVTVGVRVSVDGMSANEAAQRVSALELALSADVAPGGRHPRAPAWQIDRSGSTPVLKLAAGDADPRISAEIQEVIDAGFRPVRVQIGKSSRLPLLD
jgi:hypothetical protein